MSTQSPFRKRRERRQPRADNPRLKRLVASCPACGQWYSFDAERVNNGGMFQLDAEQDKCPHCGAEPEDVFTLSPESFQRVSKRRKLELVPAAPEPPAIEAPAEPEPTPPPSGTVYKRAAQSRNTAGMGMAPVEGTEEEHGE